MTMMATATAAAGARGAIRAGVQCL